MKTTSMDAELPITRQRAKRAYFNTWHLHSGYVYPTITALILAAIWEIGVSAAHIGQWLLPKPSDIFIACFTKAGVLLPASLVTIQEILLGFSLAIVVGLAIAMLIVAHTVVEKCFYPLLIATQVVPKVAIAPVLTVWLGYGLAPKIMVTFLIAFFPIVINSIVGFRSVTPGKLYLAQTMGASGWQIFLKIRMPTALPSILAGLKIGSTLAVVGALVGEFIASDRGLGRVILLANGDFDTVLVFAAITYLTLIGVVLFAVIEICELLLIPWHVSRRARLSTSSH